MSATLKNRTAIVTGAASGIGRASAVAFSREGAKVAVVDIQADAGNDTVEHIGSWTCCRSSSPRLFVGRTFWTLEVVFHPQSNPRSNIPEA